MSCGFFLHGAALPTVICVSIVVMTILLSVLLQWEQEMLLFTRTQRLRQAKADIESAITLYRLHPNDKRLTSTSGFQLYDSMPHSCIYLRREPWGLYELIHACDADSLVFSSRIMGTEPEFQTTLWLVDDKIALTLSGKSELQGILHLPKNGIIYGRMESDFFSGREIPNMAVRYSGTRLPQEEASVAIRCDSLWIAGRKLSQTDIPDSLTVSFRESETVSLRVGNAKVRNSMFGGRIVLHADELLIDSTCRMDGIIVVARKITVASGTRIAAQLIARDSVLLEPRAALAYPSGIRCGSYAELQDDVRVDGYVIVRDTVLHGKPKACYRQARTARLRGLLRVDGAAQLQGIVSGCALVHQAIYFSPQGYYKGMFYDVTLLENPHTALPLGCGVGTTCRKEVSCVE